jgi:hypothetical protein
MIKHATAAKIAVFTCALDIAQIEMEGTALINNADKTTSGKEVHSVEVQCFFLHTTDRELTYIYR